MLNLPTIIVTHDREEAFELAHRIAVLIDGQIQQHSIAEEVYERPATLAVARFMGVNVLSVETNGSARAKLSGGATEWLDLPKALPPALRYIAIVPERVCLTTAETRNFVDSYTSSESKKLRALWSDGGLAAQGGAALALILNNQEVTKEQPQSWFDLAAPFWKDAVTMPDPTLSGRATEFLAVFIQTHGDKAWNLFEDLARNGLLVPGPNNAALNPVLTGAKKATIAGVDYITFGQIAKGEKLAIEYPKKGTVVALRPVKNISGTARRSVIRMLNFRKIGKVGCPLLRSALCI